MSYKRSRGEMEGMSLENMAKFFMLLSGDGGEIDYTSLVHPRTTLTSNQSRVYECKTCNRKFPSFQALGGHRASHEKPKLVEPVSLDNQSIYGNQRRKKKPKVHGCSICGLEFGVGQALGGHMRKHRAGTAPATTTTTGLSSSSSDITTHEKQSPVPVVDKSASRRILSLNLDLNLSTLPTPTITTNSNEFEFFTLVAPHKQISIPPMIYSFI